MNCKGECNCQDCPVKKQSVPTRVRAVNNELAAIGMRYYSHLSTAFVAVSGALTSNGFVEPDLLVQEPNSGHFHVPVGEKRYLSLHYYRMASGNYEVTAYVS